MQVLDEIKHYHEMTKKLNGGGGLEGIRNDMNTEQDAENNPNQSYGRTRSLRVANSNHLTDEQKEKLLRDPLALHTTSMLDGELRKHVVSTILHYYRTLKRPPKSGKYDPFSLRSRLLLLQQGFYELSHDEFKISIKNHAIDSGALLKKLKFSLAIDLTTT